MGMMIVDDALFDKEFQVEPTLPIGRGKGSTEVPESLRKIIGESALEEGNQAAIDAFNVSPASVSAYKHGATSTASYNQPDSELANHILEAKAKISKRARARLMMALKHITEDKLEAAKVRDVAGVAKDMSFIIKNMEPPVVAEGTTNVNAPQFIFYAPPQKKEIDYQVIKVANQE